MAPSIEISDELLDKIGNYAHRFVKSAVLFAAVFGMAGFLGLIFITISPTEQTDAEEMDEPDGSAVGILVPADADTTLDRPHAVWITQFTQSPTGKGCTEKRTGIIVQTSQSCSGTGGGMVITQKPTSGKLYKQWKCALCSTTFRTGCEGYTVCNQTAIDSGCACTQEGCESDVSDMFYCIQEKFDTKGPEVHGGPSSMTGEQKTWAVLSSTCYLAFMFVIFLIELHVERLNKVLGVLVFWPVRSLLQLFTGVQLVNASTMLQLSGHGSGFVHFLSLVAGWLLVFCSLILISFNLCYTRKYRFMKLCGLCCMVTVLICVIIGGVMGTIDESSSSSG